jgi:hypothetical protein
MNRMLHRIQHLFSHKLPESELVRVYGSDRWYHIGINKKGRACCPVCFRLLDVDWRWGRLGGMRECYVSPIKYIIDGKEIESKESCVFCLDCPKDLWVFAHKEW